MSSASYKSEYIFHQHVCSELFSRFLLLLLNRCPVAPFLAGMAGMSLCLGENSKKSRMKKSFVLEDSKIGDWNTNVNKYVCDKITLEV